MNKERPVDPTTRRALPNIPEPAMTNQQILIIAVSVITGFLLAKFVV